MWHSFHGANEVKADPQTKKARTPLFMFEKQFSVAGMVSGEWPCVKGESRTESKLRNFEFSQFRAIWEHTKAYEQYLNQKY